MFFLEIIQEKFPNTSEQLHFGTMFKKIPNSSNTGKYGPEKTLFTQWKSVDYIKAFP